MFRCDPKTIVSGIESVVYFYTDHNNWSGPGILTLTGVTGDYINIEQTAAGAIVARVKSMAGAAIVITDTKNNEATTIQAFTPTQIAMAGQTLPEAKQSQPKGAPLKVSK
jgi:hypothetical protein